MLKQVILVRKDLRWSKGKLAAHVAHAAVEAALKASREAVDDWLKKGGKKVVLKVKDLKQLRSIEKRLKKAGIGYVVIRDAGLTQLKAGTVTAIGTVPVEEEKIDKITGKLKLL